MKHMTSRTTIAYLVTSLAFTVSAYGVSSLVSPNNPTFLFSLLSCGYLNLFVSALLTSHVRGKVPSGLQKTFFVSAILALLLVESNLVSGLSSSSLILSSTGVLRSVGLRVYQESSSNVSSIDWGILTPGSEEKVTVLIRNEGNTEITLHLATENWIPESAEKYIALSWDYDGDPISPEEAIETTLDLYVSESIEGITHFTFDIVIKATG